MTCLPNRFANYRLWIVLLCAAFIAVDAIFPLRFLGPFVGVYLLAVATALFLIDGWLQVKQPA